MEPEAGARLAARPMPAAAPRVPTRLAPGTERTTIGLRASVPVASTTPRAAAIHSSGPRPFVADAASAAR